MVQNVIILILCLVIAFWSPVLLYAAFKLLPHAYNGLNKAVRSIHSSTGTNRQKIEKLGVRQ